MTTYEERIERMASMAEQLDTEPPYALSWVEYCSKLAAAFLGDDEVYEVCPDCNGNGQVGRWEADGAFPEECSCRTGFVPLNRGDS